ncbi:XdhC family protein [Methylocystis parvus]|uniref:XdhC family protein n=1 Tax=Methylocystis parvus TaxID=134 RepID=UPI0002F3ECBD|nr:XdhC/CoxI family protein [Methylocystis parvus]WBJ99800.1 XdhC family protein [Methylocystis parvus OBBP]
MIETRRAAPVNELQILLQAEQWRRAGRGVAIATVVETFGSAPRPVGSHLVAEESGLFCGSVSAGCVEGEVITAALEAIAGGTSQFLEFGVADETAWRVGLSCGGRIAVHVQRMDDARLAALSRARAELAARRSCAVATPLDGIGSQFYTAWKDAAPPAVEAQLRVGESGLVRHEGKRLFVNYYRPGPRLVIIGAVHVAQALAPMAALAGFDVVIVDPRGVYAVDARFPDARLDLRWPDEALPAIGLDAFTAVAVLTHDPKIDDPALSLALASNCFYVGALGSRATHKRRVERLKANGVSPHLLERLRAPVGLDIAAVSPAEIGVSILAEIILARGQKPLRSLLPQAAPSFAGCETRA